MGNCWSYENDFGIHSTSYYLHKKLSFIKYRQAFRIIKTLLQISAFEARGVLAFEDQTIILIERLTENDRRLSMPAQFYRQLSSTGARNKIITFQTEISSIVELCKDGKIW